MSKKSYKRLIRKKKEKKKKDFSVKLIGTTVLPRKPGEVNIKQNGLKSTDI